MATQLTPFRKCDVTSVVTRPRAKIHYAWWILLAVSVIVGIGKGALNNTAGLYLPEVAADLEIGMGTPSACTSRFPQ